MKSCLFTFSFLLQLRFAFWLARLSRDTVLNLSSNHSSFAWRETSDIPSVCIFFLLHRFQRWQSFRAENIYTSEVCLLCPAWSGSLAMISDDKMTATHFWHLDTFCIIWILRQNGAAVRCLHKCKGKVVPWYPAVSSTTEALAADAIVLSYAAYIIKW